MNYIQDILRDKWFFHMFLFQSLAKILFYNFHTMLNCYILNNFLDILNIIVNLMKDNSHIHILCIWSCHMDGMNLNHHQRNQLSILNNVELVHCMIHIPHGMGLDMCISCWYNNLFHIYNNHLHQNMLNMVN